MRVFKKKAANKFLMSVDARLLFHTVSHDRHHTIPVTKKSGKNKSKIKETVVALDLSN